MPHWRRFLEPGGRGGRYLPWKEVARATGLSRTTAWRLQKRDEFPAPYAISPGRVGYREDEVEAWRVSRDTSATAPRGRRPPKPDAVAAGPAPAHTEAADAAGKGGRTVVPPALSETPPSPSGRGRSPPARPARRRSEHAKAIAQQMRFDF